MPFPSSYFEAFADDPNIVSGEFPTTWHPREAKSKVFQMFPRCPNFPVEKHPFFSTMHRALVKGPGVTTRRTSHQKGSCSKNRAHHNPQNAPHHSNFRRWCPKCWCDSPRGHPQQQHRVPKGDQQQQPQYRSSRCHLAQPLTALRETSRRSHGRATQVRASATVSQSPERVLPSARLVAQGGRSFTPLISGCISDGLA